MCYNAGMLPTQEQQAELAKQRNAVIEEVCDFIDNKIGPPLFTAASAASALGRIARRVEAMQDGADAAAEGD